MQEGRLLGHIISKDGIKIDPSRLVVVQKIDFPRNKMDLQSFLGKVNFLRRLITSFAKNCERHH